MIPGRPCSTRHRVGVVSGAPGRIIDIWELDEANTITGALEAAAQHPKHQATMDRMAEVLVRNGLNSLEVISTADASDIAGILEISEDHAAAILAKASAPA